jgi:hypothetical protein
MDSAFEAGSGPDLWGSESGFRLLTGCLGVARVGQAAIWYSLGVS